MSTPICDFFEKMAMHSGIGVMDFISYRDTQQEKDEMELGNSYFFIRMDLENIRYSNYSFI